LRTLLLGLGNPILTDDGVVVYVVRMVAARWTGNGVEFQAACAGGLRLSRTRLFKCDDGFFSREMICSRIGTA
jgi:Ni,Fe-hydrogenase maturation factor